MKTGIDEIKAIIKDLNYKCYMAKIPFVTIIQYKDDEGKAHRMNVMLTPEAVEYKGDTTVFYDIANILNGNFKTVIKREFEDDDEQIM